MAKDKSTPSRKLTKGKLPPPSRGIPSRKAVPEVAIRLSGLPDAGSSGERMCWRFRHVDHDGPWGFDRVNTETFCALLKKLASFETMTVGEAFGGSPGKDYEIAEIPNKAALPRLEALGLGDQTRISRFQLQGKQRLYGFSRMLWRAASASTAHRSPRPSYFSARVALPMGEEFASRV